MIGQVGCNRIARVGHDGMGWPRWGGLAYDGAISCNAVSLGVSFVLDEVGCSMLVRFSGSTPSLDHSFDGISIGISLDHTLAISFWYVLLVEPSSCNLHEGTLVPYIWHARHPFGRRRMCCAQTAAPKGKKQKRRSMQKRVSCMHKSIM